MCKLLPYEKYMEHCDFCDKETSFKVGTYYSAGEVVLLIKNGLELDQAKLNIALFTGISKDQLMKALAHEISIGPQTGWLLCPECARKAGRRIPKSAGNLPGGEKLNTLFYAGVGKMPVVLQSIALKVMTGETLKTSTPNDYKCDFCGKVLPRLKMTFLPASQLQRAVQNGFHPFGKRGIAINTFPPIAAIQSWQQTALQDTTDWGLCPECNSAFFSYAPSTKSHQMKCPYCGAQILKDAVRCSKCGHRFI